MNPSGEPFQSPYPTARFIARVVVPVAIVGSSAALLVATGLRAFERAPDAVVTPVAVIASTSARQESTSALQAPGWIEPAPYATDVSALREGFVEVVQALEGDTVERGALLARLDATAERLALAATEAEVRRAEATLAARAAELRAAEWLLERPIAALAGRARAEATLRAAEASLLAAKARVVEAEAEADAARDEFARKSALVANGAESAGAVGRLGLKADALAARAEALRSEREARSAEVESARAEVDAARLRAEVLVEERAGRAVAEAMAREAEAARDLAVARRDEAALAVARSEIRAPIAGVVLARDVRPGSHVGGHPAPVFVLYDPSSLQVRCDVPLKDAGRLAAGATAEIRVDALPGKVFRGRVTRIVPQADVQKNTVQCKVAIEDPDAALRPEMLARVRIATDGTEASVAAEVLAVPADALRAQAGDSTAEVVVAIPDGRLARTELRRVELGPERANGWREIASGLAAGDRVVLDRGIAAGMRIAPAEAPRGEAP